MPIIKWLSNPDGDFIAIEVNSFSFPFLEPIKPASEEYKEINSVIMILCKFIDFNKLKTGWVSRWSQKELVEFISSDTFTPLVKAFFKKLAVVETWVSKSAIDEELRKQGFEVAPATVAGITAPITRLCRQKGKDHVFEKTVKGDERYYRINPIYLSIFKSLLT